MNWLETTLVTLGISLDIFATMVCKGAQLSKIEKKPMVLLCVLFAVWQTAALYIGSAAGAFLRMREVSPESGNTEIIAVAIFGVLGILMIRKAWKKEAILERRDDGYAWKSLIARLALISTWTLENLSHPHQSKLVLPYKPSVPQAALHPEQLRKWSGLPPVSRYRLWY